MKSPFRTALALWVVPDFSLVFAGKAEPPRVNHSTVDFEALAKLLAVTFPYGPQVTIRVPNDTIDQVTMQARGGMLNEILPSVGNASHGGSMHGEDFGAALIACAKKQAGTVIDVRETWRPLHVLGDRDFAPPPVLLPFLIEAVDFEDAMIWHSSAKASLGLPFLPPQLQEMAGMKSDAEQHEGKLPEATRKGLESIFGCQFESIALLDRMNTDKLPAEYASLIPEKGRK